MYRTISLIGAMLCGLLLTACSHPLPKLAYPDGSNRIPINAPASIPQKAPDVREPIVGSAPSGEKP
jgi:putative hemolysin